MTEIQNNFFGIKWPTGVDMLLNKTQTLLYTFSQFLLLCHYFVMIHIFKILKGFNKEFVLQCM